MKSSSHRLKSGAMGVVALVALYLISLAWVCPVGNFPLLDDWVYARSAVASAAAGKLVLTGYESAWSLPQVLLGAGVTALIGPSHVAFRAFGVISLVGLVTLLSAYMRKLRISAKVSFVMCSLLLFNPVAYLLSATFMTDLPFVVLWVAACFAWDTAFATRSRTWTVASIGLSSLAIAQRQFGIVIPCAVVLLILRTYWSSEQPAEKGRAGLKGLLCAAIVAIFAGAMLYLWMRALGGYQPPLFSGDPWRYFVPSNFKMVVLLSLGLLPAGVLIGPYNSGVSHFLRFARVLSLLVVFCGVYFLSTGESILYGNLLSPFGIARTDELLVGERPVLFLPWMNGFALALGIGMFVLTIPSMITSCASLLRDSDRSNGKAGGRFGAVLVSSTLLYLLVFSLRGGFDRYLLPALPGLLVIAATAVNKPSPRRLRAAYGALVCMGALSVALLYDYFRWNEVKWQAATELVSSGVSSAKIHAGYEWHGWYHGDSSPFPGGLSSGYSHAISFSDSIDSFSVKAEKEWVGVFPPFRHKIFVLERVGGRLTASVP